MKKTVLSSSSLFIFISTIFPFSSALSASKNMFEGSYVGASFGYGLGYAPYNINRNYYNLNAIPDFFQLNSLGDLGLQGPVGGLQWGYNKQYTNRKLNGIEISLDLPPLYLKGRENCQQEDSTHEKIEAKKKESLGIAFKTSQMFGQSSLGYVKLGVRSTKWSTKILGSILFQDSPFNIQNSSSDIQNSASHQNWLLGGELGVGTETMILPNLSLGIEGSYVFYRPSSRIHFSITEPGSEVGSMYGTSTRIHPRTLDVRVRLEWYV